MIDHEKHTGAYSNTTSSTSQYTPEPKRVDKPILHRATLEEVNKPETFIPPQPQRVEEHKDVFSRPTPQPEVPQTQ